MSVNCLIAQFAALLFRARQSRRVRGGYAALLGLAVAAAVLAQSATQPHHPPSMALADFVARFSVAGLIGLIGLGGLSWLVDRADYALPALKLDSSSTAPPLTWCGRLSQRDAGRPVIHAPVHFRAMPHEGAFVSETEGWRVTIRRLIAAHLFLAATPWGGQHAARLHFEDDLSLERRGVIISSDAHRLEDIVETLSALRLVSA
ncbi:MAG: hypothetical protein RMM31_01625 [Anaerolineae bacterium]|nr:hypothetical protein [Anaerolineae bacterium]